MKKLARLTSLPRCGGILVFAFVLATLAAGCGGGAAGGIGSVAGVGSGGSGIASGAVSGLASVIVDGVEYDDISATRQTEDASGTLQNAAVKLGQQVRVRYAGANRAQSIEVQAQLAGPVTAAMAADGTLRVMGQHVRVVIRDTNATQSTATVLEGYASGTAIAVGDDVEVHGSWTFDSSLASHVLVATRIEKLQIPADPVRLGGVVVGISGNVVRLNAPNGLLVSATSLPALAQGNVVRVWAARSALSGVPVPAVRMVNTAIDASDVASGTVTLVSGLVSDFDAATRTFSVQGMRVRLDDGVIVDTTALAQGQFAVVRLRASGSTLLASGIQLRSGMNAADLGRVVRIQGVTRNINWNATTVAFTLRGAPVQAPAAAVSDTCRAVDPTRDFIVDVRGIMTQSADVLTATQVTCSQVIAGQFTGNFVGTITTVDMMGHAFTLVPDGSAVSIRATWDSNTFFAQGPAMMAPGRRVYVEGLLDTAAHTLRLTRVELK